MTAGPRFWSNGFIVAFLAIQFVLPLRGLVYDKLETRGNFTWNMYSKRYACRIRYHLTDPSGTRERIDPKDFFVRRSSSTKVFHRDTLPLLHRYLCDRLASEGRLGRLEGDVACSLNFAPRETLVPPGTDVCADEVQRNR